MAAALAFDELTFDHNNRRTPHPAAVEMEAMPEDYGLATQGDDELSHAEIVGLARREAAKFLPKLAFDSLFQSKGNDMATRNFRPRPGGRDDIQNNRDKDFAGFFEPGEDKRRGKARDDEPDDEFSAVLKAVRGWSPENQERLFNALSDDGEDDAEPRDQDRDTDPDGIDFQRGRMRASDMARRRPAMDSAQRASAQSNFDRMFPECKAIKLTPGFGSSY